MAVPHRRGNHSAGASGSTEGRGRGKRSHQRAAADVVVENGDLGKGDLLLRYDVLAAKDQEVTLTRQLKLEEKRLEDQLRSNSQRQETLKRNIGLREKILKRLEPLEEAGAISEVQILQEANRIESLRDELLQLKTKSKELETTAKVGAKHSIEN